MAAQISSPNLCLVVEDSPLGVAAARDAGIRVAAVPGLADPSALTLADVVLPDIRALLDYVESSRFSS